MSHTHRWRFDNCPDCGLDLRTHIEGLRIQIAELKLQNRREQERVDRLVDKLSEAISRAEVRPRPPRPPEES